MSRSGNPFHMLHHSAFDCNYGNAQVRDVLVHGQVPLDYLFGTFAATREDVRTIWKKQN